MNSLLDNGLFATIWVGFMWGANTLLGGTGEISFKSLMLGALLLVAMGIFKAYWQRA